MRADLSFGQVVLLFVDHFVVRLVVRLVAGLVVGFVYLLILNFLMLVEN